MSHLPQPGTEFWYLSALNTKIVVLYLGKIPRRKHDMLLYFANDRMLSVVWLTDEQLAAQLTQIATFDDRDRLPDATTETVLSAFQRSKSTSALVNNLRTLSSASDSSSNRQPVRECGSAKDSRRR